MKGHIGKTDRIIRALVGVAIAAAGIYFKSWWGLIAIVPLTVAAIGWCPGALIGISCKSKDKKGCNCS